MIRRREIAMPTAPPPPSPLWFAPRRRPEQATRPPALPPSNLSFVGLRSPPRDITLDVSSSECAADDQQRKGARHAKCGAEPRPQGRRDHGHLRNDHPRRRSRSGRRLGWDLSRTGRARTRDLGNVRSERSGEPELEPVARPRSPTANERMKGSNRNGNSNVQESQTTE